MLSTFSGPIAWPGGRGARSTALLASRSTSVSRRFRSRLAAGCTARHIGRVLSRLAASEQGLAEIWLAFFVSSSAGSEATIGAYLNASRTQRRSGENDTPASRSVRQRSLVRRCSSAVRCCEARPPKGPSDKGFCTELAPRRKNGYRFSPVGECHDVALRWRAALTSARIPA